MQDTIAAISTALGVGAISIIRVSGPESIPIVDQIFSKSLIDAQSHTIHYGFIMDEAEKLDEVLVMVMRAPKTFTTEDTVEINCHGGITTTHRILELLLTKGARLAEPGEFTKRAFLNGRIDLVEAESVMDLIEGKTEAARKLAINGLEGRISQQIRKIREKLVSVITAIEVNIDYPEYEDIEEMTNEKIKPPLLEIQKMLTKMLADSQTGKLIKNGIQTIIVGRPNVGKSSILNRMLNEQKAIVTDIAGTTRDIVEGSIQIDGVLLNIIDTAGIRETKDVVEKIGVEKSLSLISEADLVLIVLNNNEPLTEEDQKILSSTKDKANIVVINKNDLPTKLDFHELQDRQVVEINTLSEESMLPLYDKIKKMFQLEQIQTKDYNYLSNVRQISLAKEANQHIVESLKNIETKTPIDMVEIDIKQAWEKLGEMIGETYTEELLDELFQRFCVGK